MLIVIRYRQKMTSLVKEITYLNTTSSYCTPSDRLGQSWGDLKAEDNWLFQVVKIGQQKRTFPLIMILGCHFVDERGCWWDPFVTQLDQYFK